MILFVYNTVSSSHPGKKVCQGVSELGKCGHVQNCGSSEQGGKNIGRYLSQECKSAKMPDGFQVETLPEGEQEPYGGVSFF